MPEIGTSGSMSGDGKRGVAAWPKLPRPSSTLPKRRKTMSAPMSASGGESGNVTDGPNLTLVTLTGNRVATATVDGLQYGLNNTS
jgi:hypothetical protein